MTVPPPRPERSQQQQEQLLTLDLLILVLSHTLFHPFLAALLPLCLRALATPYTSPSFILTSVFAAFVAAYHAFAGVNRRWAYGPPRKVDWEREVVVITGGKGGLGGVLAEVLGLRGVAVGVLDVDVTEQEEEEKVKVDGVVRYYRCDVGDGDMLERVWGRVVADLGVPTILINNAAISQPSPFMTQTPQKTSRLFAINTLSHFHLTRLYLHTLLASTRRSTGGHIVTVSSVLAHLGAAHLSAYTASKAALLAYHASLAAELAQTAPQIKMVLVAQGQLDTAMFRDVQVRGWLQRFLGPVIGAQEVAMGIVRLLDEGMGGEVRVPVFAGWIAWLGVLPVGLAGWLRGWSGVDSVVDVGGEENRALKERGDGENLLIRSGDGVDDSDSDGTDESE